MIVQPLILASATLSALAVVGLLYTISPPPARLAKRVRPYAVASRTSLGGAADSPAIAGPARFGSLQRVFGPLLSAAATRIGRLLEQSSDEVVSLRLRQSGLFDHVGEDERLSVYRLHQLGAIGASLGAGALMAVMMRLPTVRALSVVALALVVGATRQRGRLDRAIEARRVRMRIEIYTVNQLLAMRVRTGGGVVHAVSQLIGRGRGDVVGELAEVLRLHRAGLKASDAFLHAARITPEPACSRTYALLAAAEERGADLAGGLLELSEDVREARREAMRRAATKRRAAMLLPIIGILAPVMLLFIGAPLPQLVLNWR